MNHCPEEEDREDGGSLRSVLPSASADQPARGRKREPSDPGRVGIFGRDGPGIMRGAHSSRIQYSPHKPSVRRPRPSTMSGRASAPAIHRTRGRRKEE